jgi:ligand-binding SRPBCC domain-containing protein
LRRLSPPPIFVQLHRVAPLAEGSVSEFTMWFGPLPVRWTALHRQVSAAGFTDVQLSGPLAVWEHRHSFEPTSDGRTHISEHIEYRHHSGRRGLLSRALFNGPGLRLLFAYRRLVTTHALRRKSATSVIASA